MALSVPLRDPSGSDWRADAQVIREAFAWLRGFLGSRVVTALPSGPYDGQEVYYVADSTNGVVWHLVYRAAASGSFKWEFVGGSPMRAVVVTRESTTSLTYADLATAGPAVTVPLAGDYLVDHGATIDSAASGWGIQSVDPGGAGVPSDDDSISLSRADATNREISASKEIRLNGLAASDSVAAKYRTSGASYAFSRRYVSVRPVRVG